MSPEQRAAAAERMAKARAAKATKKPDVISGESMPKQRRQKRVKRVIVDNDLIKPKA